MVVRLGSSWASRLMVRWRKRRREIGGLEVCRMVRRHAGVAAGDGVAPVMVVMVRGR